MNILQDRGQVSDNCVLSAEVAEPDIDSVLRAYGATCFKAGLEK